MAADPSPTKMQNMQNNGSCLRAIPSHLPILPMQRGNNITSHTILHLHQYAMQFSTKFQFYVNETHVPFLVLAVHCSHIEYILAIFHFPTSLSFKYIFREKWF